jgi:carbon storage regulator CsrA
MLVLTRKNNEQVIIQLGDKPVVVRILAIGRDRVRIGVTADPSISVHREEVARRIQAWQDNTDESLLAPTS